MKSAVAVTEERRGYQLLSILMVAFMTMLMVGMLGARSASADPKGDSGSSHSNGNSNGHDKDDSDADSDDDDHGKSDEDHGKPDDSDDDDDADADSDDDDHGKSDEDHGKSGEDHGNGKALGHLKNKHAEEEEVPVEEAEEPSAAPVSNQSKAGEIVLGARQSRGRADVAPAQVAGASSGAALPFTGPEDLIPFLTAAFGLMGSGGYLWRKNSK